MKTEQITKSLKERKSKLEYQTRLHGGLISHNYIIVVGAFTVCKVDGKVTLKNDGSLPSQWTADGVEEIKEKCSWTSINGNKMKIQSVPYKEWYKNELQEVNDTLSLLETA
ncbi:MAG: hypothetical protein CMJ25_04440 [Phycisphaerae bacterium]|nr:hypothetical protein [Phycisphaerae bacterium]|tara:strand:+ start:543 stop:875 length:333 start_codon:yes stop_codon:yes gene_type:complete